MSSIVTSILGSTVGLLWNANLKDGDVTDTMIRQILVRELDDVKTKLDGLSRKDLLSSYRFLKEGVALLNVSLDKSKLEQNAVLNDDDYRGGLSLSSGVESCILNEALQLSLAMGKLKIASENEFESAKKRFEEARKTATHAFCNEALSIQDRIFAAKLRVVSEILECLDCPETAVTGCLSFLQDLHSLPAIREIFSVYLNRGIKSMLYKVERVENMKSVMLINYVLFHFNLKFSRKLADRLRWPGGGIEIAGRCFNPIFDWQEVSTRKSWPWSEELMQPRHEWVLDEKIYPFVSAVNRHGQIVVSNGDHKIKVFSRKGENKMVKLPDCREDQLVLGRTVGLAVDHSNNIHIIRWLQARTERGDLKSYVLCILDENYNVKHSCTLAFLEASVLFWLKLCVNKNSNIIMIKQNDPHVYVCDNNGKLKCKFNRNSPGLPILSTLSKGEIITSSFGDVTVHLNTEEGNFLSTIVLPEGHEVCEIAFHYIICKIAVLTKVREKESYFLLCYTETGELETTTFFCNFIRSDKEWWPSITSHPSGPVAIVRQESITFT